MCQVVMVANTGRRLAPMALEPGTLDEFNHQQLMWHVLPAICECGYAQLLITLPINSSHMLERLQDHLHAIGLTSLSP